MKRTALACTLVSISTICAADTLPVTANAVFTVNRQELTLSRASRLEQSARSALTQSSITCLSLCQSQTAVAAYRFGHPLV